MPKILIGIKNAKREIEPSNFFMKILLRESSLFLIGIFCLGSEARKPFVEMKYLRVSGVVRVTQSGVRTASLTAEENHLQKYQVFYIMIPMEPQKVIEEFDHFLIESVTAENFQNGIEFQAADQGANYKIHIKDVKVNNNGGGGMLFSGTNGTDCPAVSGIEGITIKNVTANGNRYGIGVSGAGRVIITGSKAAENSGEGSYGIAADCVKDFEITENSEVAYNSDSSGEGGIGIVDDDWKDQHRRYQ